MRAVGEWMCLEQAPGNLRGRPCGFDSEHMPYVGPAIKGHAGGNVSNGLLMLSQCAAKHAKLQALKVCIEQVSWSCGYLAWTRSYVKPCETSTRPIEFVLLRRQSAMRAVLWQQKADSLYPISLTNHLSQAIVKGLNAQIAA